MHIDLVNIENPEIVYGMEVSFKTPGELAKKFSEKQPFLAKLHNGNKVIVTEEFLSHYFPVIITPENVSKESD